MIADTAALANPTRTVSTHVQGAGAGML